MENFLFALKKLLAATLLPPMMPLLFIALGLAFARTRRIARLIAWSGLAMLWLMATPLVARMLCEPLQDLPVVSADAMSGAQAIVILGGERNFNAPEYGGQTMGRMALERLRYGSRLAKQSGLPVLVTGGNLGEGESEAVLMKAALEQDFGVAVRWMENAAADTRDNARFSAKILSAEGVTRVVLVTHALHMRRAMGEFSGAGLAPIAAPTGRYDGGQGSAMKSWLPNANALYFSWFACHEWLGNLAARLRD